MPNSNPFSPVIQPLLKAMLIWTLFALWPVLAENKQAAFTVNGSSIGSDMLELLVVRNKSNGLKDTPELRQALKNELIAITVLSQEARKLNLDKSPTTQGQLQLARHTFLAELAIKHNAENLTITDAMLKAEYQRQLALLENVDQYLVSNIVLPTEAEAIEVLKALNSGQSFDQLAKDKSIDNSKNNGGSLGWILSNQLIAPLDSVVTSLSPGALSVAPISTQVGWQVIKLQGKRKFQPPSLEESKPQLERALLTNHRAEYVQKLVKSAKIESK
jgi:peptidyl-prolyl cis-trans isomerase C